MEIMKESIIIDKNIGKETSQILVEGDIIVPDTKPDIEMLLQKNVQMCIDNYDVSNERVSYKGNLDINIIYLARNGEKPVHSINHTAAVNDFINMEGIDKNMWFDISGNITNIDYKIINDRKINFKAVVDIKCNVVSSERCDVVSEVSELPEVQIKKKKVDFNKIIDKRIEKFSIKDELTVPSSKPDISDILEFYITVANKEVKCGNNKITLSGELIANILYKSDTEDSLVDFYEREIPFNGSFEVNGAEEGMYADVELNIQNKFYKIKEDEDGESRLVDIEILMCAFVEASCEKEIEVVDDVYCINKDTDFVIENVKYPSFICRNKNQFPVKETVLLGEDCPNILQVFRVNGNSQLEDMRIVDDRVIVEGIINADILYVAENDSVPLYCYNAVIPYKQTIEAKGVREKDEIWLDVKSGIERIGFNMLSDREIELRFVLSFNVCAIKENETRLITNLVFSDVDKTFFDKFASITIYVVKPGDTLWKIAKRYNTSIAEIVRLNDIENPDKIYPGQRFLILKNSCIFQ